MSGTIFTALIITVISSIIAIFISEFSVLGIIMLIISSILAPFTALPAIILIVGFCIFKNIYKDEFDDIINRIYWFLCIFITIIANIISKFAHWGGNLKTIFASLLILTIFYIINKVISKNSEINELNNNIEWIDSFLDIAKSSGDSVIGSFISSTLKIIITTILIIISALILKVGIYGTHLINDRLCNKYGICILQQSTVDPNVTNEVYIDSNSLKSNFENTIAELNNLIEKFKNDSKEENDKNFADFYKKLRQKAIDIRTYTINDITYFYEKDQLLQELEKESIKFSNNKQTEEIILNDYPIFKFGYFETTRGFEVNYEYLISQVKPYLSEQWISYLLLIKEQELDRHKLQTSDDGVDSSFCMKWKNKLETFLTTYPDFYLKDDIKKEIESYKEALKSIGLE